MVVKDKSPKYINILLAFWGALLIVIYMLTITTSTSTKDRYYEIMESASQKAELAFQKIKEKKQELGLSLSSEDKYQSGCFELAETFDFNLIKNNYILNFDGDKDYLKIYFIFIKSIML